MADEADNSSGAIAKMLAQRSGHVHLVGVCGVGMAGLAFLLKSLGFRVSGCDARPNRLAAWLRERGIEVADGHDPAHIGPVVEWAIHSAAVSVGSSEIRRAGELRVPVFTRGAVLPELLQGRTSVAVGGTHGKTTTASFIAQVLRSAGRDPAWCIGGEVDALDGVAGAGNGGLLVVEADESDGTIAGYRPDVAVITNIEFDHMEHFANVEAFEECFRRFASNARRAVVYGADDPRANEVCGRLVNAISFGFSAGANVRCSQRSEAADGQSFIVSSSGETLGAVRLPAPGRHNALNALAATAVGLQLGLTFGEISRALEKVSLPRRRFERVAESGGILVISDYAHHPSEIAALVQTALTLGRRRIVAVFQPHRYTRTLALGPDFPPAFDGAGPVVLTPVYAASEVPLQGGTTWDLYAQFRAGVRSQESGVREQGIVGGGQKPSAPRPPGPSSCLAASSLEDAWGYLRRELREGDVLLVVGAGDVEKIAQWAKEELEGEEEGRGQGSWVGGQGPWVRMDLPPGLSAETVVRRDEPLAWKTTLKVGGAADIWAEVVTREDLAALLRWTHGRGMAFHVLGAGSNVLVSDLGVRGVTARLTGANFRGIREQDGTIVVGAATPLAILLDWLEKGGWAGVEFLEGIPGTVGGAVRMNAGAWGREIVEALQWIRCLEADGTDLRLVKTDFRAGYRSLEPLKGRVVVEAGLRLHPGDRAEIARQRAEIAERRRWMRGLRCAGSVFKNPARDSAGRLIDQAGLKGRSVGGAAVSDLHANVIVASEGASASDVRALIEIVRNEVRERSGVLLEPEIKFLGSEDAQAAERAR